MERNQTQDENLLSGFRFVYADFLRPDLSPQHREHVVDVLNEIATNCVDAGMGRTIAVIAEDEKTKHRLVALRQAWLDGEIEQ